MKSGELGVQEVSSPVGSCPHHRYGGPVGPAGQPAFTARCDGSQAAKRLHLSSPVTGSTAGQMQSVESASRNGIKPNCRNLHLSWSGFGEVLSMGALACEKVSSPPPVTGSPGILRGL